MVVRSILEVDVKLLGFENAQCISYEAFAVLKFVIVVDLNLKKLLIIFDLSVCLRLIQTVRNITQNNQCFIMQYSLESVLKLNQLESKMGESKVKLRFMIFESLSPPYDRITLFSLMKISFSQNSLICFRCHFSVCINSNIEIKKKGRSNYNSDVVTFVSKFRLLISGTVFCQHMNE